MALSSLKMKLHHRIHARGSANGSDTRIPKPGSRCKFHLCTGVSRGAHKFSLVSLFSTGPDSKQKINYLMGSLRKIMCSLRNSPCASRPYPIMNGSGREFLKKHTFFFIPVSPLYNCSRWKFRSKLYCKWVH